MEQKFQGFNLSGYTDEGEKSWDVRGETADVVGSSIKLSNVDANAYGEQKVNVTAEKGTIDQASGDMQLETDVIIKSEDGSTLETDYLDWNRDEDLVSTEEKVTITDSEKGLYVTGQGMTAKPGLKNAQINKDITLRVDTKPKEAEKEVVEVTCDGPMTINQAELKAEFIDNVVAFSKDRTLKADKMTIYFEKDNEGIKEMICEGNVEIIQGESVSLAEKAIYNAIEKKLTMTGRPKLKMTLGGGGLDFKN